jgi:hypothetical protein
MYTCLGEPPGLLANEPNDAIYQSPHWLLVFVSITGERLRIGFVVRLRLFLERGTMTIVL